MNALIFRCAKRRPYRLLMCVNMINANANLSSKTTNNIHTQSTKKRQDQQISGINVQEMTICLGIPYLNLSHWSSASFPVIVFSAIHSWLKTDYAEADQPLNPWNHWSKIKASVLLLYVSWLKSVKEQQSLCLVHFLLLPNPKKRDQSPDALCDPHPDTHPRLQHDPVTSETFTFWTSFKGGT